MASESSSEQITVTVQNVTGEKHLVTINPKGTIAQFKEAVEIVANIPVDRQKLIFAGQILKDEQTVESYLIKNGLTVHLVKGTPKPTGPQPAASKATPSQAAPTSGTTAGATDANQAPGVPANPFDLFGGLGSLGGLGGMGGTGNFQQMQQQMLQNPAAMREMMNSPIMEQIMQNPELLRSMLMGNPQMREIIEHHPEVGHVLNDPATLRQTLEFARNPELLREMTRNADRTMSHIENLPEGFNQLRRMYTDIQEPMMNATTGAGLASLFSPPVPSQAATESSQSEASQDNNPPAPTSTPLPNPWGPPPAATTPGGTAGATGTGLNPFNMAGLGMGSGGLGSGGLGGLGTDPNALLGMLQNPAVQQMMQGMLSNPELLSQMNPMMQQLFTNNPQLRTIMSNPELIRMLTNPQAIQAMMQLAAMQRAGGSASLPGGFDFGMPGGVPSGVPTPLATPAQPATPAPTQEELENRFSEQLTQLRDMGFIDTSRNIQLLLQTGGNVDIAVDRLLNAPR